MTELVASVLDQDTLGDLADSLRAAKLPVADLSEPCRLFIRFDDKATA